MSAADLGALLPTGDLPCPTCGYNLRDITQPACPECGQRPHVTVTVPVTRASLIIACTVLLVANITFMREAMYLFGFFNAPLRSAFTQWLTTGSLLLESSCAAGGLFLTVRLWRRQALRAALETACMACVCIVGVQGAAFVIYRVVHWL